MFFVYGIRSRVQDLGQKLLNCPNCHRDAMTGLSQSRRWFTLFWIPLFPISGKTTAAQCGLCGYRYAVDTKQAEAMLATSSTSNA